MALIFDEYWWKDKPIPYSERMRGLDVILFVYGKGKTYGYLSDIAEHRTKTGMMLDAHIRALKTRGSRVYLSFDIGRGEDGFVDIHDPDYAVRITDIINEAVIDFRPDGVCLDFVRTTDYSDPEKNHASMAFIVKTIYDRIDSLLMCCAKPLRDYEGVGDYGLSGRNPIQWANDGYMDIILDMNYGKPKGYPPDLIRTKEAQLLTDVPVLPMISCYEQVDGESVPSTRFEDVVEAVRYEDYCIYPGWCFTEEHKALL